MDTVRQRRKDEAAATRERISEIRKRMKVKYHVIGSNEKMGGQYQNIAAKFLSNFYVFPKRNIQHIFFRQVKHGKAA